MLGDISHKKNQSFEIMKSYSITPTTSSSTGAMTLVSWLSDLLSFVEALLICFVVLCASTYYLVGLGAQNPPGLKEAATDTDNILVDNPAPKVCIPVWSALKSQCKHAFPLCFSGVTVQWLTELDTERNTVQDASLSLDQFGTTGNFRLRITGKKIVFMTTVDGTTARHNAGAVSFSIYLPMDCGKWDISSTKRKSPNNPSKRVYAVLVEFPTNVNGLRSVQVSLPVVDNDIIPGVLLTQALQYANNESK